MEIESFIKKKGNISSAILDFIEETNDHDADLKH